MQYISVGSKGKIRIEHKEFAFKFKGKVRYSCVILYLLNRLVMSDAVCLWFF